MIRIGLTGGIAAGKSVASQRLRELGAVVIDHDQLARDAVAVGTDGLRQLEDRFGPEILHPDGSLNRTALASVVFGDEDSLRDLNGIVHPIVETLSDEAEHGAAAEGAAKVIVHDIPLLIETGQQDDFDHLVVVHAPADLRIARLVEVRHMSLPDARRRVASQVPDQVRVDAADTVLDGTKTPDDLRRQVDDLWQKLTS
ncbi:dephospho-CoA kinase [Micrococcales bacterium KH10]|nr:dephospho-CoA kinase [Micrococcales bacterium KH10]